MPGIRIDVNTSGGIRSLADFRKSLKDTGADAKLSAWEIKQLEDRVKKNLEADKAARAADKYANSIRSMGKAAGLSAREMSDLERRLGSLRREAETANAGSSSLSGGITSLAGAFSRFAPQILAATGAYLSLGKAMETVSNFVNRGFDFNKTMETASLGIASILSATQEIVTAEGRRLQGVEKLNAAQAISRGLMKDIQIMGLQTAATTRDLVDGFQMILGPATQAGMSLDQTKKAMIGIVQAFGALGIPLEQLSAESRSLFDGDIKLGQDRLAGFLGITKELVLEWQKQGVYFDKLNEKLEAFRVAGDATAKTWTGLSSNLAESFDVIAGRSTEGLFDSAKTAVSEITGLLIDTKNLGLGQDIQNIVSLIRQMGDDFGSLLVSGARALVKNIKDLDKWIGENREKIESIYEKWKSIGSQILEIVGKVFSMVEAFVQIEVATSKADLALGLVKASVTVINELVGYVELAFWGVSTAIVAGLLGPLADVQNAIAALGKTSIGSKLIDAETVAALEQYAAKNNATVEEFENKLAEVASKYRNTPFPAFKEAYNPDVKTKTRDELFREEHNQSYRDNLRGGVELQKLQNQELAKQKSFLAQIKEANSAALSVEQRRADAAQKWTEQRTQAEASMAFAQKTGNSKLLEEATAMKDLADAGVAKAFDDIAKAATRSGLSAAKSAQDAENALTSLDNQIAILEARLSGDTLKVRLQEINKTWDDALGKAKANEAAGKISADQFKQFDDRIKAGRGLDIQRAQAEAAADALKRVADIMGDIADASGSPALKIKAGNMNLEAWERESRQAVEMATRDEAQRAELMAALEQGVAAKRLEITRDAYESMSSVSQKYWDAEKALIEQNLAMVKETADDELAYKIYAAQQWDDFNRRKLESQANSPRSQAEAIQAVFTLDSGSYKSEMGRLQDSWKSTAESMLSLSNDLSSGIAQGFGDALRGLAQGDIQSFEDVWRSMLNRLTDAFASFLEDLLTQWLKRNVFDAMLGGTSATGGSAGGILGVMSSLVEPAASALFQGGGAGVTPAMSATGGGDVAGSPWASGASGIVGGAATGALAGSWMPVIGTLIGAGIGLLGGLLTQQEEEREAQPAYSASSVLFAGGNAFGASFTVMDDGSMRPVVVDPEEIQALNKRLKETFRSIEDNLDTLGIDVAENWRNEFSFFSGVVHEDLASWAEKVMLNQAIVQAAGVDLATAIHAFSTGSEFLVDTLERLGTALAVVKGSVEVLGIDFERMASINDSYLLSVAGFVTAWGGGVTVFEESLTEAAASVDQMGQASAQAVAYLERYRRELTELALAQYADMLMEAVGGEDAFKAAMATYSERAMGDKERSQAAVTYYESELLDKLAEFSGSMPGFSGNWIGTNTDAFWSAYTAAMQQPMPPSLFEKWAELADLAAGLEDSRDALAERDLADRSFAASLDARRLRAQGLDATAELTERAIQLEQELADARANGATVTQQAALAETQAFELQAELDALLGVKAATQDYGSALTDLQEAISWQIEWTSKMASEALAASSAFKSLGQSLRDTIEGIVGDTAFSTEKYGRRNTQFSSLYRDAMAGDQEAMGELGKTAEALLEAARGALSYQEYAILEARTLSRLGSAATYSERQAEYQGVAGDIYTAQGGLLERMLAESKDAAPDAAFIEDANSLLSIMAGISDAAKAVADGGMSADAFRALAGQAESSIMQTDLLDRLLAGTLDLGSLGQDQAQLLLSSADALAALSDYTGRDVDLSDQMRQQLEIIAAGVTAQDQWATLITTVQDGQAEQVEWLKTNIAARQAEADRLYAEAAAQTATQQQMEDYFQSITQFLMKQTEIERLSSLIEDKTSQAATYQQYAMMAMIAGVPTAAMQHMQTYQNIMAEVARLQADLAAWESFTPQIEVPALAAGGITTRPTLAMVGEGGVPEVIAPLGDLMSPLHDMREDIKELRKVVSERLGNIDENAETTRENTDSIAYEIRRMNMLREQENAA